MRPTPSTRHLTAVTLFVCLAAGFGLLAMRETSISPYQAHLATAALKAHDSDLYPTDPVYGPSGMWQVHTPIFESLLKLSLVPSHYEDAVLPFRLLTGVVALVYMCGMYALLFQQCRSWSVAAYVTILSAAVLEAIPGVKWGFGSLGTTIPETLCLAGLPLILLAYLHYERQWRVVLVFGAVGLLGNLDLSVAINITLVLAGVYVARQHCRLRAFGTAGLCLAAAALGVLPYLSYILWLRASTIGADLAGYETATKALAAAGRQLLYPDILISLLNWRLVMLLLLLGVPSILVLVRVERYRVRHQSVWVAWLIASLVVGFGLQGLSQVVFKWIDRAPVITFFSAVRLAMLPLFVLLAQALTNLFRLAPARPRAWLQWLGVLVMICYVAPSENLRVGRYAAWDAATSFLPDDRKPTSVLRHRRHSAKHAELMAIAGWARIVSPVDAVFLTDNITFRMASQRAIAANTDDLWYYYYLSDDKLTEWVQTVRQQARTVLYPPAGRADPLAISRFVWELTSRETWQDVESWYILLESDVELIESPWLKEVLPPAPGQWGQFYRLYLLQHTAGVGADSAGDSPQLP